MDIYAYRWAVARIREAKDAARAKRPDQTDQTGRKK